MKTFIEVLNAAVSEAITERGAVEAGFTIKDESVPDAAGNIVMDNYRVDGDCWGFMLTLDRSLPADERKWEVTPAD